jgi:hypothetical protein
VEAHKFKVAMAADLVALWHNGRITVDRGQKEVSAAAHARSVAEPSRRFLGCHGVRRHLQQLGHERIGTLALALEVRAVAGRSRFQPL